VLDGVSLQIGYSEPPRIVRRKHPAGSLRCPIFHVTRAWAYRSGVWRTEERPFMRFLRFLLWLLAIGAASLWFIGFANRFQGFACVRVTHTCSSDDLRLQWHVLLWLAPPICLACLWLLRTSGRSSARFQRSPSRPVAQRQAVPQGAQFTPAPMTLDGPPVEPLQSIGQTDGQLVERAPRHAAKDHFITLYDPPANGRPRHAAPEPEPEW
jgi:hypothetical protein